MSENIFSQIESWIRIVKDANESLATVMRHDQDHDDWHRMHGDEPCTSEADCAQKRAKYAEVKDEQEVTKGDVEGHEFHGNQYTGAVKIGEVQGATGHTIHVQVLPTGGKYGLDKKLTNTGKPMVEFYDKTYAGKSGFDPEGQFITRYNADTLAGRQGGLILHGGEPAWSVPANEMAKIQPAIDAVGSNVESQTAQITSDSKTKPTVSNPAANLARTHTSINNALKAAVSANGDLKDLIRTSKSSKTRGYYGTVGDDDLMWGTHLDLKDAHEKLAALHTRAATQATKVGDTELANAHIQAANAHRLAAETANDRRNRGGDTTPSQAEVKEAQDTARKSARAISASQKILDGSKTAQITSDSQTRSGTSNVKFGPSETSKMRSEAARLSNQVLHKEDAETDAHVAHIELANSHANAARSAREDGLNKLANAHQNAANAHANAAVAATLGGDNYTKLAQAAGVATAKADNINYERPINDGIAGGIIASDFAKADQMGHEFRGNQYSQGQGGGSSPARRVDEGRWNPGDWNPGDHPVLPLHPDFPEHRVGSPFQTNQWEPPIHRTPDAPYTTRPTISPDGHQEPEAGNPFRSNQWHPDGTRLHGMPEITQPEQGPSTHQEGGVGNRFNPTSPSKVLDYLRSKYGARDNG